MKKEPLNELLLLMMMMMMMMNDDDGFDDKSHGYHTLGLMLSGKLIFRGP